MPILLGIILCWLGNHVPDRPDRKPTSPRTCLRCGRHESISVYGDSWERRRA